MGTVSPFSDYTSFVRNVAAENVRLANFDYENAIHIPESNDLLNNALDELVCTVAWIDMIVLPLMHR